MQLSEQLKNAAAEGVDLEILIERQRQHVEKCNQVAETPLPEGTPNAEVRCTTTNTSISSVELTFYIYYCP